MSSMGTGNSSPTAINGRRNDTLIAEGDGSDDTISCGASIKDVVFADLTDVFPTSGPDACEVVR